MNTARDEPGDQDHGEDVIDDLKHEWGRTGSKLDERLLRRWAAEQAREIGNITLVSRITGLARNTIRRGLEDLAASSVDTLIGRVRLPGGGRKQLVEADPELMAALDALIEPLNGADESPLRWTCRSTRDLAKQLSVQRRRMRDGTERDRKLDKRTVAKLLHDAGYSLRANRRRIAGSDLPIRETQFKHVNSQVLLFLRRRQPVIAVDTGERVKDGESRHADLVGWPAGDRLAVTGEDGRLWSSVGIAEDTAGFAVAAMRRWWQRMGSERFPDARRMLVVADCGGRDDRRTRIWRAGLQEFADVIGLSLTVCHLPRGTTRWCAIEQRFVRFVRKKHRDPAHVVVVSLVGSPNNRVNPTVDKVSNVVVRRAAVNAAGANFDAERITPARFCGAWNYMCVGEH